MAITEALLQEKSIDPREVIRLEPTQDGTRLMEASDQDKELIKAGYSVAETMLPKVRPANIDQFPLFN